ncbi:hypothetical protein EDB81DRAFT_349551 [Dactylonectria macrodidyma]|uniref:Carrier domain-containing protein n=1 Tax=Dactylonectria macrodidyma TaxID=307937 RepID=A0A9P9JHE9_9HYPO|nr:hypothetical protein EDB81DRAFT_349551 [Dactylonectria macrodidyma]
MDSTGLSIINEQAARLPGPNLLHCLVNPPSKLIALDYLGNNKRISFNYSQLHDAADALAIRISRAAGSVRGHFVVPVLIHQSPLLYISLLAILKAGGAFCPLNIDAPPERVKFILKDVDAAVVLVSRELLSGIPEDVSPTVLVVDEEDCMGIPSPELLQLEHRKPTLEDLAYVMYTSGSTGTPKGVGLSHDAATQALLAHDRHIPSFSRFLQFAAPTFDVSVFEIFFPLFRGCTLVTIRRAEMLNDLPAVLRTMEVDACELTPTVAGSLLRKRENAPNLKVLLTIGEMLNAPVVEEFGGNDTKASMLWAMYGPTEATIHCTLQTAFATGSSTGNIGVPLDTVSCFIVEEADPEVSEPHCKVLPQGEIGELAVGGYQLAIGYINRPEQTSSVFIQTQYGRVYRTGDKARLRSDGVLECLGRISDGQVKLRGQRLELGEVEQAVLQTSGCHSAVAAVVKSILVVFCAVDVGVTDESILEKCKDWLPQYMVPGEVVLMDEFPRLPSGKVDRKKMKADYEQRRTELSEGSDDLEPTDELEAMVIGIVSDVLNFKANRSTSLASAGLDSLRAIKLASALRECDLILNSASLLSMKSVSDIVFAIRLQPTSKSPIPAPNHISLSGDLSSVLAQNPALQDIKELVEDVVPCTPLQLAMLAETARESTSYCNEIELEAPQGFTAQQILTAFVELAQRNEILRVGFATLQNRFVSVLFKELRVGQTNLVDEIERDFAISGPRDYINPLRIQIARGSATTGPRVLVQLHHAIYDGWSMDILLSDLSTLLSMGTVAPRPPFRDVVKFYNGPENQVDDDAARVFWTEHLVGWNKVPFPKLNPRVGESNAINSTRTQLAIPKQKVDDLIQSLGCSTQVIFQASLALLWSGITGVQDVLVGSVTSGRTIPVAGVERIVGPCIASLPLRVDLGTVTANLDLLNSIQSSNRKAMQHCMLPLGEIRKLAGLQPGESLYDILFAYQESLDSSARASNLVKETNHLDRLETPVLFEVEPTRDGFALQVTHRPDVVPSALIMHVVEQFEAICLNVLENSTKAVQVIQRNINVSLSSHNTAPGVSGVASDLSKGFEEVALEKPTLSALCFAQQLSGQRKLTTMSFQELNRSANQLGRHIRYQGARIGDVVAIIMDKSPTLYISILAILKAGCAYLPILPSTPAVRIQEILKQAKAKYCLVDDASSFSVPRAPRTRWINVDSAPLLNQSKDNLNTPTDGSRLAYVIYTSGTTGVPKGVAVTQQNIMSNLSTLGAAYPASSKPQGRFLQACSQAFDVSVFEIFYAWHMGMCLCTGMNDTLFEDLEKAIRDLDVTHLSMTPTVASLVDPQNVPSVEFLVTAGERLSKSVLQSWHEKLWQGYGPSELTNICSVKKMASGDTVEHLGHALPNTSTFVVFPSSLEISPIGWVGELCFGGSQVAWGYLNMPGLTRERFVEHPQYGRLYRTGDLGRMLDDGSIMFLDRLDGQIKLRGQRIEASEINSVTTSTGFGSSAATLLARRERTAAEQLVLFYVPEKGHSDFCEMEVDVEKHRSLFALLQSRLPAYMIPSYLVPVSTIPLIPSGKVDQRALHACFEHLGQQYLETVSGSLEDSHDDGNWTSMESTVAATISRSTKSPREDVGRWTPLTMLGVDSISAIHLGRELGRQLKRQVAVSEILQHPTVAQLARHLSQDSQSQDETGPVEFFPSVFVDSVKNAFAEQGKAVESVLPCMPLQEAMLSRGQRSYYNKVLLRLHIDPEVIRSFWKIMAERHDILRTCFATTPDSQKAIAQVVLKEWDIPWLNLDVTELSFDGAVQEHLKTLPDPVDSQTPPASLALLRYRGSLFLSFICHHALYDATAMERLLKEVEALARRAKLPPPASYKQFLRTALVLPGDVEQFWLGHFRGYRPSNLFAAMTNEMDQCTHTTSLDLPLTVLQTRTRNLGTSLLSVCQASWANVLSMAHGRHDVCFGNVVGGRTLNMEGLDRLVAPCFNSIPVRVDFSHNWSNIEMAKHLQKLNTDLIAYQFTPLRLIQRKVNRTGRHLFETLLLVQTPLQDIDSKVWTLEEDSGDMDIPLVCEVVPCPSLNSLVINIHRDMNIVTDDVATALAEAFKLLLKATLTSPHATIMDRKHLPTTISSGLSSLKPRQERVEATAHFQESEEEWNEIETKVRQILSQLSGIPEPQIHRHTTIFQLGLDSINAVQIASILRQEGFGVSASDVIECPTTSKIAAKLHDNYAKKDLEPHRTYDFHQFSSQVTSDVSRILPDNAKVESILPCTPVQSAMIASFLQSHGGHYLNAVRYKFDQSVDIEELKTAWDSLQASHPMLRTGFVPVNHNDASFAMVRYHPGSTSLPLEMAHVSQNNEVNLFEHKIEMARSIQDSLRLPPWKVVLVDTDGYLSMNLIIHHALYDASSLHVMLEELSRLLKGHQPRGFPPIEPALSIILCKSLGERNQEKEFWQAKAGQAVVNKFPVMTPLRIEDRVVRSDVITSSLSFSKLQQATQASNISVQAAIQAAWTRVLASYLGESSVVFGVALSGRITDETRGAPFPCLNTVPIVVTNDPSNAGLVKCMMEYNQHLHKHQFSPLGKVQKWLGHPTGTVFDTLIAYQKMDTAGSGSIPWEAEEDEAMVEYPVSLEIEPVSNDQIRLCITYFSDILPQEQAQILVEQFDLSLAHIACNPNGQEDDTCHKASHLYSILPAASPTLNPPVQLLHQFVETGATSHPNKIALEFVSGFDGETPIKRAWTYREFDCLGNKVANILRDQAAPGSIVAIHFDKCPEAYFSILGILKAGCSFVALDPTAPIARKQFILQDSKAPCLLTTDRDLLGFEIDCNVIPIHTSSLEALEAPQTAYTQDISPSDTCYCLYTSGTTGTPKGCEITHNNAVEAMMAFQELFRGHWDVDSRWLQFAALHFDVSVLEQYWSWSVGIAVVAAPKDLILDDLTASINRLDITHIDLTPSLARLTHPDEVPSLCRGVFITGGEQLKQEILDVWGPKAVIYNAYGPTEATIGVTMYQRVPVNGRPSNIGQQFPNVGSYIFRQGTEIPVIRGGVGELCVSGKLVGKGYLNRPELTEERFPTLKEFGKKIYRTGDLVRVLHDGCFDFLGRADDQVKLRGQRLEIAEINHAIRTGVDEIHDTATIVAQHGTSGKDVLVSFVVGRAAKNDTLHVLTDTEGLGVKAKEACRTRLPGYMVPTYIFSLPYIPLSSNNKSEVKELKKLFGELSPELLVELSRASTKPVSAAAVGTMTTLTEGIAEFSNMDPKDLTSSTSIFDVGVDSITALRLSALLKARGLQTASPAALLKYPIIGDLANSLSQTCTAQQDRLIREVKQSIQACGHRYRGAVCRALGVKATNIEYIAPCSPLQQGIISRTMTSNQGDAYFNTFELQLADTASVESLRASWDQLVQSESILRTAFVPTTNGFVQVALRNISIPWEEHSLEALEHLEAFLEGKKQHWIQQNSSTISTPLRLIYLTTPVSRKVVIQIFHALYDGNSFDIMMQRLLENYRGQDSPPGPSFLEALTYGPLLGYDNCQRFWEEHLQGWSFTPVPQLGQQQEEFPVTAMREVSANPLEQVRSSQNVTLQAVTLSLWAAVLKNYIANSATIGVIVSGRAIDLKDVEHTVGPLFNTVPFHSKALQNQTWSSLIRQCHEFNTAVLEFQHVPLNSVQKWCSGGKALFDNLFAFQIETPNNDSPLPWETIDSHGSPDYPLALEVVYSRNGNLRFTLVGQGHIVTPTKLDELLDQLEKYITLMGEAPNSEVPVGTVQQIMANQTGMENVPVWAEEAQDFQWTEEALILQHEIALLADIPSRDVSASVTVLELGLDSIEVIKLSVKLKRRQVIITPSQIMRCQSIAKIIEELEKSVSTDAQVVNAKDSLQATQLKLQRHLEKLDIRMDAIESVLPPTPLQESMVAGMIQSDFESYYNHDILEISESVDVKVLRHAWQKVVDRSPILRTSFFEIDSHDLNMTYCQVVLKPTELDIHHVHLGQFDDVAHIIAKATERARDGKARHDLFQVTFTTLGSRQFVILSMAHALYDGWSLSLLFRDLQAAYNGEETIRPSSDSFLSQIVPVEGSDAKDFWSQYLEGATPTLLPHKEAFGVGHTPSLEKREQTSTLPLSKITSFCRQQSISLQVLCQACWAIMLAQQMRSLDVTFGVVVSGRDFDEAQNLMFPTMNTVALRCVLYGSPSSFLRYLEENMGDIREFQNYPLRKAQLAANVDGQGLFNTLFILQKSPTDQTADPMFKSVGGSSATEYPVCVEAEAVANSLVWRIACQSDYCLTEDPGAFIRNLEAIMQFLMTSDASDILSFKEQGVSICGMPPITLQDDIPSDPKGTQAKDDSVNNDTVWNTTASEIRKILHKVSDVPLASIMASDTLYNLGLDSISAIKVASLLRKKGFSLRPQDLIRATSISQMAEIAATSFQSSTDTSVSPISWVPTADVPVDNLLERFGVSKDQIELLPALPMQVYMLSAWENAEGCVFYPEFPCLIDGVTELEAVQTAWDKLVAETPLLRTCFIATQSSELPFLQVILKDHRIPIGSATQEAEATDLLKPLIKVQVAQNNSSTWTLRLSLHHALYDGVSLPALLQRLSELLGGATVRVDSGMSRWRQFTISQASDKAREARRMFWTEYLQGVPPVLANKTSSTDVHERVSYLEKSALSDLTGIRSMAAQSGISIQALFLAAYAKVLTTKEKATSVVFGIYLANRAADYDLPSIYPTLNLVPLRVDMPVDWSLSGVATTIQQDIHLIASEGRADVGLWEISNWTGVRITSFVNFLSLPDTLETSGGLVKLIPDGAAGDSGDGPALLAAYRQYQNNMVKDHFSIAVDVEASVQETGLDIGIFGSRQQVSADEAAGLVLKIASVLNEFSI